MSILPFDIGTLEYQRRAPDFFCPKKKRSSFWNNPPGSQKVLNLWIVSFTAGKKLKFRFFSPQIQEIQNGYLNRPVLNKFSPSNQKKTPAHLQLALHLCRPSATPSPIVYKFAEHPAALEAMHEGRGQGRNLRKVPGGNFVLDPDMGWFESRKKLKFGPFGIEMDVQRKQTLGIH